MSEGHTGGLDRQGGMATGPGIADGLGLAAAPAFAVTALLAATHANDAADVLCSAARGGSSLGGMLPMYLLMCAVHCPPWVRLIVRWRKPRGHHRTGRASQA